MRRQTRAGCLVMIGLLAGSLAGVTSVLALPSGDVATQTRVALTTLTSNGPGEMPAPQPPVGATVEVRVPKKT